MIEKSPWNPSREVVILELQFESLRRLRKALPAEVPGATYEVIEAGKRVPEIIFKELPGEPVFDHLKEALVKLSEVENAGLAKDNAGHIVTIVDENKKEIKLSWTNQ